jgi:hypothetical protein
VPGGVSVSARSQFFAAACLDIEGIGIWKIDFCL